MGTESQLIKIKKSRKVNQLAEYLVEMSRNKFTGYIKVNFSQGSIGRVEKFEEVLKKT